MFLPSLPIQLSFKVYQFPISVMSYLIYLFFKDFRSLSTLSLSSHWLKILCLSSVNGHFLLLFLRTLTIISHLLNTLYLFFDPFTTDILPVYLVFYFFFLLSHLHFQLYHTSLHLSHLIVLSSHFLLSLFLFFLIINVVCQELTGKD